MWSTAMNKVRSCSMVSLSQDQIKRRKPLQCGPVKGKITSKGKVYKISHCIIKFCLLFRQWQIIWGKWTSTSHQRLMQLREQVCPNIYQVPGLPLPSTINQQDAIPHLGIPPQWNTDHSGHNICTFTNKYPSADEWRKEMWYQYTKKSYSATKKNKMMTLPEKTMYGKANTRLPHLWSTDYM